MVIIEEKLRLVRYNVDVEAHIKVHPGACKNCPHRACTYICPAGCFTVQGESDVIFSYTGCLECGSCRVICDQLVIEWNYPRGGFGVTYRYA